VKSSYHSRLPRVPASKHLSPSLVTLHHGDENPVTISPLDSALTNRDACNSFRMRSYKNCRVSPASSSFFFFRLSFHGTHHLSVVPFFSYSYALQIPQALCFDIHTKCPGVVYPPHHSLPPLNSPFVARPLRFPVFLRACAPSFPGALKVIQDTSTSRFSSVSSLECSVPKRTWEGWPFPNHQSRFLRVL
jgi:hypothetical protein